MSGIVPVIVVLALVLGVLAAASFRGVAQLETAHPPSGEFVEVRGVRLHIVALGPPRGTPSADPAVVSRTTAAFLLLAVMQFPGAVAFALDGVLIGGHDERFLGRAAVVNLVSYLPLAAATLAWPQLGIAGLWGAQLIWMFMRSIVNQWRFSGGSWLSQVF